jgi:hypothetical protein
MSGWMQAIAVLPNGDFVVAGGAVIFGVTSGFNQRWNGSAWAPLGANADGQVFTLSTLPNGEILAGGSFGQIGGVTASAVARWSGAAWQALGIPGLAGNGGALTFLPNGDIVAGGFLVARWNGTTWLPLGAAFTYYGGPGPRVRALATLPSGDVVAGGQFTAAGSVPVSCIARWNGTTWLSLGSGMNDNVFALATMPNGTVIAGGQFTVAGGAGVNAIARWNGTAWSPLGSGVTLGPTLNSGQVYALAAMPNGDMIVGGYFDRAGGLSANNIARWNGTTWSSLGAGSNSAVTSLAVLPNGNVIASGSLIARWNGVTWLPLGAGISGNVLALVPLPNGDLIAGGDFMVAGGQATGRIARWSGTGWSPLGTGADSRVQALAARPDGDVFVGGEFSLVDGVVSPGVARLTTNCPATATSVGAGCNGSGGSNVLTATSLPWTGSTLTATALGMPVGSLAVQVLGWTALSTPLAAILPQGAVGCSLLVSTDSLTTVLTGTGTLSLAFAIPNTVTLANQVLRQQVVALEIGAGSIVAATSTNSLVLRIGAF